MLELKNLVRERDEHIADAYGFLEAYILASLAEEEKLELVENCEFSVYSLFPSKGFGIEDLSNPESEEYMGATFDTLDDVIAGIKPRLEELGIAIISDDEFSNVEDWNDHILRQSARQWLGIIRCSNREMSEADYPAIFHEVWEHELLQRIINWEEI